MKHAILATALAALTTLTADAALITWGAAQNITGDSDVSTNGTLVGAFNVGAGGVGATTVNGTTFTGLAFSGSSVTSGNFTFATSGSLAASNSLGGFAAPFTNLSTQYQTLLSSIGGIFGEPYTLTMSGLTAGDTYEFQWWTSSAFGRFMTQAAAGNSVTLNSNTTNQTNGLGQFALGTFVADATGTQTIIFSAVPSADQSFLNAFQLRNVAPAVPAAVPEPGTALAGVMLAGLLGVRRRRGSRV